MVINFQTAISNIDHDTNNWKTIGDIKEKQKIQIKLDKNKQGMTFEISRGSSGEFGQAVSRTWAKIAGKIASAEQVVQWIHISLLQTKNHLTDLKAAIEQLTEKSDPKVLATALKTLRNLKEHLQQVPLGLENLKDTYKKRLTEKEKPIPEVITLEQDDANNLTQEVSKLIVDLGEKLQNEQMQEKDLYNESTASEKGIEVARELIQGKANDIVPVRVTTKKGNVEMPKQFSKDIGRMISLKLNGIEIYSRLKTYQFDTVEAFQKLCKAFGENDENLRGRRVAALLSQAYLADITKKVLKDVNKDPQKYIFPCATDQYYSVNIKENKIQITIKTSFNLIEPETRTTPEQNHGAIIVKREIEIPIDDLSASDLETSENPLPNIKVVDTYSKTLQSGEYAAELVPIF